jgi:hypothetical protein
MHDKMIRPKDSPENVLPMYKFVLKIVDGLECPLRFFAPETAIFYSLRNYPKKSFTVEDHQGNLVFDGKFINKAIH